eukprot:CFRG5240T1
MDEEGEDICRFCRSESTPEQPLFHPCLCMGSIKYIHQECLVQWLNLSGKSECELCNHTFMFRPVYAPDTPKNLPRLELLWALLNQAFSMLVRLLRFVVVAVCWLGIMPFAVTRVWRMLFSPSDTLTSMQLDTASLAMMCVEGTTIAASVLFVFLGLIALNNYIVTNIPDEEEDLALQQWQRQQVRANRRRVRRARQRQLLEAHTQVEATPLARLPTLNNTHTAPSLTHTPHLFAHSTHTPGTHHTARAIAQTRRRTTSVGSNSQSNDAVLLHQSSYENDGRGGGLDVRTRMNADIHADTNHPSQSNFHSSNTRLPIPNVRRRFVSTNESVYDHTDDRVSGAMSIGVASVYGSSKRQSNFISSSAASASVDNNSIIKNNSLPFDVHARAQDDEWSFNPAGGLNNSSLLEGTDAIVTTSNPPSISSSNSTTRTKSYRSIANLNSDTPQGREIVAVDEELSRQHKQQTGLLERHPSNQVHHHHHRSQQSSTPPLGASRANVISNANVSGSGIRSLELAQVQPAGVVLKHQVLHMQQNEKQDTSRTSSRNAQFIVSNAPTEGADADANVFIRQKTTSSSVDKGKNEVDLRSGPNLNHRNGTSIPVTSNSQFLFEQEGKLLGVGIDASVSGGTSSSGGGANENVASSEDGNEYMHNGRMSVNQHTEIGTFYGDYDIDDAEHEENDGEQEHVDADTDTDDESDGMAGAMRGNLGDLLEGLNDNNNDNADHEGGEGGFGLAGLFDGPHEDASFEELVGLSGPITNLMENLFWVLLFLSVFVFVFAYMPCVFGSVLVSLLNSLTDSGKMVTHGLGFFSADDRINDLVGEVYVLENSIDALTLSESMRSSHVEGAVSVVVDAVNESMSTAMQVLNNPILSNLTQENITHNSPVATFTLSFEHYDKFVQLFYGVMGYIGLAIMASTYLRVVSMVTLPARFTMPFHRAAGRAFRKMLTFFVSLVKVCGLVVTELGLFPLACGWWLDICALPVISATLTSRLEYAHSNPSTAFFLHWIAGMLYMSHFAAFVGVIRDEVRPGVLWFLRNPNDPGFQPVKEMIELPISHHARRIVTSAVMYGLVVLWLVYVPVSVACFLGVYPAHVMLDEPLADVPVDLVLFHLILPWSVERLYPSDDGKSLARKWLNWMGEVVGVTKYILVEQGEGEEVDENAYLDTDGAVDGTAEDDAAADVHGAVSMGENSGGGLNRETPNRQEIERIPTHTPPATSPASSLYTPSSELSSIAGSTDGFRLGGGGESDSGGDDTISTTNISSATSALTSEGFKLGSGRASQSLSPGFGLGVSRGVAMESSMERKSASPQLPLSQNEECVDSDISPVGSFKANALSLSRQNYRLRAKSKAMSISCADAETNLTAHIGRIIDASVGDANSSGVPRERGTNDSEPNSHVEVDTWSAATMDENDDSYNISARSNGTGESTSVGIDANVGEDVGVGVGVNADPGVPLLEPLAGHEEQPNTPLTTPSSKKVLDALEVGKTIPQFRTKMLGFVVLILLSMLVVNTTVAVIPVSVGRLVTKAVIGRPIHDLYSLATGIYVIWGQYTVVSCTVGIVNRAAGTVVGNEENSDSKRRVTEAMRNVYKVLVLGVCFVLVIPCLFGLMVELLFIIPLTVSHNQSIIFHPIQTWAMGIVLAKVSHKLLMIGPDNEWKEAFALLETTSFNDMDIHHVLFFIARPVIEILLLCLTVPYVLSRGLFAMLIASPDIINSLFRYSYILCASAIGTARAMQYLNRWVRIVHDEVKKKKYLVDLTLLNIDDTSGEGASEGGMEQRIQHLHAD